MPQYNKCFSIVQLSTENGLTLLYVFGMIDDIRCLLYFLMGKLLYIVVLEHQPSKETSVSVMVVRDGLSSGTFPHDQPIITKFLVSKIFFLFLSFFLSKSPPLATLLVVVDIS